MDEKEYLQIEKYLNNELKDSDRKDFEARMDKDPEFAATVRTYKDISTTLQARAASKVQEEQLKGTLENISSEFFQDKKKRGRVIPLNPLYWAAAASILLILSFLFILSWQSAPSYSEYAHYEPLVLTERSEGDQTLKVLAEEAFNEGQYIEATQHLEELAESTPDNINIKLYLALSYIEIEKYEQAEQILKNIEAGKSVYQTTATWYLALSYLKQEKTDAAKAQLKEIPEGSDKYVEARELLEEF